MYDVAYFVKNSNTLGYMAAGDNTTFGVLAGSVIRGGDDWKNGPTIVTPSDVLVPATKADFDLYRVCSKGHI